MNSHRVALGCTVGSTNQRMQCYRRLGRLFSQRISRRPADAIRSPIEQLAQTEHKPAMFAKEFSIKDLERLGAIVEGLLQSDKLTEDEKWAVDQSCRAAADLAQIRHLEIAREFYARPDMEERCANSISEWIVNNFDAKPGTVTAICGRMFVASYGRMGGLGCTRFSICKFASLPTLASYFSAERIG